MDDDVTSRTLRLLVLLQSAPSWTPADLADRLGTSPRTLRRDLRRLHDLGYTVHSRPGPGGHYRLGSGSRMPPLTFEDDEVVALVAALRMAEQGVGGDAATRALVKLRQVLPRPLAEVAGDVAEHSESVTRPGAAALPDLGVLAAVSAAAGGDRAVRFAYMDRHDTPSDRHADSLRCLCTGGHWYLLGFDRDRRAWRVFRLDRVRDVVADAGPSPRRDLPASDLGAWLASDFGRSPRASPPGQRTSSTDDP